MQPRSLELKIWQSNNPRCKMATIQIHVSVHSIDTALVASEYGAVDTSQLATAKLDMSTLAGNVFDKQLYCAWSEQAIKGECSRESYIK